MIYRQLEVATKTIAKVAAGIAFCSVSLAAVSAEKLVIESWRNDDAKIWNDVIIPEFKKSHPDIDVVFSPTPPSDYNSDLTAKLKAGTAGDS